MYFFDVKLEGCSDKGGGLGHLIKDGDLALMDPKAKRSLCTQCFSRRKIQL